MRKVREEHCVTVLEWRPDKRPRSKHPKTTQRRTREEERHEVRWQSLATIRALCSANQSGLNVREEHCVSIRVLARQEDKTKTSQNNMEENS